jgi:putative glutamine amidotransferase
VDAVSLAGGLPLLLPTLEPSRVGDALDAVDAVLLSSGGDVDPACYGQQPSEHLYGVDGTRDAWELALVEAALRRAVPVLAICRGAQVLNVARGGTLLQDLPSVTDAMHRDAERFAEVVHPVELDADSRVAHVMGGHQVGVNTLHHQAVDRIGSGLRVVGRAADGTIEAIETDDGSAVLGVQWHPELLTHHDEHLALFTWIVARGEERRRRRTGPRLVA